MITTENLDSNYSNFIKAWLAEVKEVMITNEITQSSLADDMGVLVPSINPILKGKRNPSLATFLAMSYCLGIEISSNPKW